MKNLTAIQKERINQFEKTLNKNSKFYNEDLQNFINNVSKENKQKSEKSLSRVGYLNSDIFAKKVKKEINKLDDAGLFNISKMKVNNSLD